MEWIIPEEIDNLDTIKHELIAAIGIHVGKTIRLASLCMYKTQPAAPEYHTALRTLKRCKEMCCQMKSFLQLIEPESNGEVSSPASENGMQADLGNGHAYISGRHKDSTIKAQDSPQGKPFKGIFSSFNRFTSRKKKAKSTVKSHTSDYTVTDRQVRPLKHNKNYASHQYHIDIVKDNSSECSHIPTLRISQQSENSPSCERSGENKSAIQSIRSAIQLTKHTQCLGSPHQISPYVRPFQHQNSINPDGGASRENSRNQIAAMIERAPLENFLSSKRIPDQMSINRPSEIFRQNSKNQIKSHMEENPSEDALSFIRASDQISVNQPDEILRENSRNQISRLLEENPSERSLSIMRISDQISINQPGEISRENSRSQISRLFEENPSEYSFSLSRRPSDQNPIDQLDEISRNRISKLFEENPSEYSFPLRRPSDQIFINQADEMSMVNLRKRVSRHTERYQLQCRLPIERNFKLLEHSRLEDSRGFRPILRRHQAVCPFHDRNWAEITDRCVSRLFEQNPSVMSQFSTTDGLQHSLDPLEIQKENYLKIQSRQRRSS